MDQEKINKIHTLAQKYSGMTIVNIVDKENNSLQSIINDSHYSNR